MKAFISSVVASAVLLALPAAHAADNDVAALEKAARAEGQVNSVGMPDTWANWKDTWNDLSTKYGLKHSDTDMSSAQELAKFAAEQDNASADIGDVGAAFGPIAVAKGVAQPYKPTHWDQIPAWAKDADGNWMLAYTGTIAFLIDKQQVKDAPHSWADLKKVSMWSLSGTSARLLRRQTASSPPAMRWAVTRRTSSRRWRSLASWRNRAALA